MKVAITVIKAKSSPCKFLTEAKLFHTIPSHVFPFVRN